jgi:hypothetical protein
VLCFADRLDIAVAAMKAVLQEVPKEYDGIRLSRVNKTCGSRWIGSRGIANFLYFISVGR